MPDPFAAGLKVLFSGPCSDAGIYTPPNGDPAPIRVILESPDQEQLRGDHNIILATNVVQIQRADVAEPLAGSIVEIVREGEAHKTLTLVGDPSLDDEGVTWRMGAEEA